MGNNVGVAKVNIKKLTSDCTPAVAKSTGVRQLRKPYEFLIGSPVTNTLRVFRRIEQVTSSDHK